MSGEKRTIPGGCFCGAVRFEIETPTDFCSHCHCESCRRSHGAAFVTWTGVPLAQYRLLRGSEKIRKYESSPGVRWCFCADCGTSLLYEHAGVPNRIYMTVANLDEPLDQEPEGHVSYEEKVAWLRVHDGLPKYRGKSDQRME